MARVGAPRNAPLSLLRGVAGGAEEYNQSRHVGWRFLSSITAATYMIMVTTTMPTVIALLRERRLLSRKPDQPTNESAAKKSPNTIIHDCRTHGEILRRRPPDPCLGMSAIY